MVSVFLSDLEQLRDRARFLLGYYRGQDYYSLEFRTSVSRVGFGVAFDRVGRLTFSSRT